MVMVIKTNIHTIMLWFWWYCDGVDWKIVRDCSKACEHSSWSNVWLIEYWNHVCLTTLLQGWCFSVKYTDRLVMSPHKIANQHQSKLGQVLKPFKHNLNWGWKDIGYHKSCRCLKSPHLSQQIARSRRSGLKALRACASPNFPGVLCCLISWFFLELWIWLMFFF